MQMLCKYCKTKHVNKTKESKYTVIGNICLKCSIIVEYIKDIERVLNMHVSAGDKRPRRKIVIKDFTIEKI